MIFIIGGILDDLNPVSLIQNTIGSGFDMLAEFVSDFAENLGIEIDPEVLAQIVGSVATGGLSGVAMGAVDFATDAVAEEFRDVLDFPVEDTIDAVKNTV